MEIDRQTNCFFAFTKSSPTMICLQRIPNVMMPHHPPTRNHHAHFYPRMLKCVGLMMIDMMCVTSGMTTPPKKKKSKKVAVLPRRNMNSRPTTTQVIQRYPEAFAVILAKSGLIGWVHPPPGMQRSPTSLTTYFFRFGDLKKEKTSFIIVHQPRFPRNKGVPFPWQNHHLEWETRVFARYFFWSDTIRFHCK